MRKIIPLIFSVFTSLTLLGQANGGWGVCEFATVAAMTAYDPSGSTFSCKKVYVQATDEHYRWDGSAWVKESEDVTNIYTEDGTVDDATRTVTLGTNSLLFNGTNGSNISLTQFNSSGQVFSTTDGTSTSWLANTSTGLGMIFAGSADLSVNGNPGTTGQVLTSAGNNSAPTWNIASNIYNNDGSLLGNRTMTMGAYSMNFDMTSTGDFNVLDNGTVALTVQDDGDVGIGTSTPDARLDVEGGTVRLSDYGGGTYTGAKTYYLGVDIDGDIIEIDTTEGPGANFYNVSDTLTSNRVVEGDSKNLTFTNIANYISSAATSTFRATGNMLYEADKDNNGSGEHQFYIGTNERMTIENAGTIDLSYYGTGATEDNDNNTFDLAVDTLGNVIEVDRRVRKIDTTTLTYAIDQNDLSLTGLTSFPYYEVYRLNPTADIDITGIDATGVKDGQLLTLMNVSDSKKFKIKEQDVLSSAANRFETANNDDEDIRKNGSVTFIYDSTSSRWRVYILNQ